MLVRMTKLLGEEEINQLIAMLDHKMPVTDEWVRRSLAKAAGHFAIFMFNADSESLTKLMDSPIGKEIAELCNPMKTLQLLLHLHKARCEIASIKAAEELIGKTTASG